MATRTEDRFGEVSGLGTTYTSVGGPVPASTTWNVLFNVTNVTGANSSLRLYIADTSWTSGEPTAGTLKVRIAYDLIVAAGETLQITGFIVKTTEEIVARASVAASLDVSAHGVMIT